VDTTDDTMVAPFPEKGAFALLVSTMGDDEPELPDVEVEVGVTVLLVDALVGPVELAIAIAVELLEDVTDAVPSLATVVVAVVLAVEDAARDEPMSTLETLPTV
jgi:hypothetical protein